MNVINKDGLANAAVLIEHLKNEGYIMLEQNMIHVMCELLELAYFEGKVKGMDEGIAAAKRAASDLIDFFDE